MANKIRLALSFILVLAMAQGAASWIGSVESAAATIQAKQEQAMQGTQTEAK